MPFAVLLLGVLAGGMCALLALNTATAASEVRERRLDAANATLNATQEQLSRSISGLQAPSQLARMAAALGLVPARSPAYLRINPNGTVTVLGRPAPVVAPPKIIKLTPAQKAAAKAARVAAAKAAAAKAKAAQAKAAKAKAAQAKAAKSTAAQAKAAKTTAGKGAGGTAKGSTSPSPTAPSTGASPSTAPTKPSPTKPSPTKPSPTKPSPTKTGPTKPSPTKSPVPTATTPGGPR